jgi:hypothetical protein
VEAIDDWSPDVYALIRKWQSSRQPAADEEGAQQPS